MTAGVSAQQFCADASVGGMYWRLANKAMVRHQAEEDWARTGQVYADEARLLVEEGQD